MTQQRAIELYQTGGYRKDHISKALSVPRAQVRNWLRGVSKTATIVAESATEHYDVPLSESIIPKIPECTAQEFIDDLRGLVTANPEKVISRNFYRVNGKYSESAWSRHFGTFHEARRQAGVILTRQQHAMERSIAKHASVDHYRKLTEECRSYGDAYERPNDKRFKQVIIAGDFHDKNVSQFALDVFLDTCQRIRPDVVVLNGDLFDNPETSFKHVTDPREWDAVGRIKFVHENILKPLREACPDSQIDFICGNHEARLLKHLADATPALRAILSDLHGMTIGSLFGLDRFQINFICKSDLATFTLAESHKEARKNYKTYFDSFIVSHEPYGMHLGYPGVSGHHHKTKITPLYNELFGAYSWVEHGTLHRLDSCYSLSKWQHGFCIATCDTETRKTVFDTVTFNEDFAIVGGAFYQRKGLTNP